MLLRMVCEQPSVKAIFAISDRRRRKSTVRQFDARNIGVVAPDLRMGESMGM